MAAQSYNILPTPPSPTRIITPSPSLSPSNSNSNSAGSSVEPATPPSRPRGRVRSRYPDSIGRVPLHRRGTSDHYECLEDLLREAGYKETRVFTPQEKLTNKAARTPDDHKTTTIGASFVGFLSNLVPSRSASLKREEDTEVVPPLPPYSPPISHTPRPSATQRLPPNRRGSNAATDRNAAVDRNSVLSARRSAADLQHRQRVDSVVPPLPDFSQRVHQPVPSRPTNRYYQHHPSSSRASGVISPPPPPVHHPTPTRASTYLRHMTSYERPQSTPATTTYSRVTDDAEEESLLSPVLPPRMPTGWMENVKRAREYFAIPQPPPVVPPVNATKLGRSVSAKTRGRLSDRTNANATGMAPPLLTTRLSTGRARRSESQVSVSRVVCRSRGSSPVRRDKGKARDTDFELRGQIELPNAQDLARTLGVWNANAAASAQLLSPPRRRDTTEFDSGESDGSSSDGEEITLARILVPSRHERPGALERSRSVRSLRRCLELDGQQNDIPPVPPLPLLDGGNRSGRWSVSLSWGRARGEAERTDSDDPEVFVQVSAHGRGTSRQRGVLPTWAS
ncbi:hypothetical protein FB45DRAFT_908231 [Roridomyces roridus]|uniref:Uncharacterized protein n=1 Tax=Roridomyces roridus TaxID=1738132 RepID=A0AAD7FTJ2_9AGAR|nr:hypothetical protein FB45DRAFT_908231 [Roridomyces roridus]